MSIVNFRDCLTPSVGLSRTDCECYGDDRPDDAEVSESGLYIDEAEDFNLRLIHAAEDCTTGTMWQILHRARLNAIQDFRADLLSDLANIALPSRPRFDAYVGENTFVGTINPGGNWCGITFMSPPIPAGRLTIPKLRIAVDRVAPITIFLYDNLQEDPLATYSLTSIQGKWAEYTTNLELTLYDGAGLGKQYWLIYDRTGVNPMKTGLGCSSCTGFLPKFDLSQLGKTVKTPSNQWYDWLVLAGTYGSNPANRDKWVTNSTHTYGIQILAKLECVLSEAICLNMTYDDLGAGLTIAQAIQYKAAAHAYGAVLNSGAINYYTMLTDEAMWHKRGSYLKRYNEKRESIIKLINLGVTGCFKCKPLSFVGTI